MLRRIITATLVVGFVAAVALAAGCGSSSPATGPTPPTSATSRVSIIDFQFQPSSITVPVGAIVSWKNNGAVAHTVTSDTGVFDSGQLQPGMEYVNAFNTAGTYPYHCSNHPTQMSGTVIVTGSGGATTTPTAP